MARKKKVTENPLDVEHGRLVTWVNESDDNTTASRALSEKCRDYYDSKQWTDEEIKTLKQRKQAATVINRIKPKMDGLMGLERTNKTTAKAFPRTPRHDKASTAATEAIRFVLQNNFYDQVRSSAWDNILIEGTGGVEIIVKPKNGDLRITINHLMWDRLIYDTHSRKKNFSDANYLGQVVWMDYDQALARYPNGKDVLETTQSGSTTYDDKPSWSDTIRKRVKIVELYYRKNGEVWYAEFTRGGFLTEPKVSPYVNEEGETEWPYEFASAFVEREGGRYGAALQLLDVQDEINKRRSKALHLMSVRQVRLERGAVEDVNKTRQELAKPDGVVETTPGMEFEVLKTGDMAAAQFNLLAEAKQEIDAVSYSAAAAGKDTRAMSGVALRSRELAGQTELAPLFAILKNLDLRVYRKVWNRVKQYWKEEKWIRVTDDENNLKWVGLNKPVTRGEQVFQQAQEQGIPPQALQQLQVKIQQDPSMQEQVTENDIANLDVDIIIDDAPDAVNQQVEDFQVLGEMVKSGFPMPPIAVIEASPLSNKDRIIKLMQEGQQLPPEVQQQMQQMKEQAEKLAEENQKLKTDQSEAQLKIKAKQQEVSAELELKSRVQDEENRLAIKKAEAEMALKRWVAEQEMALDKDKQDHAKRMAEAQLAIQAKTASTKTVN